MRTCKMNNSADTKVSGEGGRGGAAGTRTEIPLQSMVQTDEAAVPLQPMEEHVDTEIHLQFMLETQARAGEGLRGVYERVRVVLEQAPGRGLPACEEWSPCWSRFADRSYGPMVLMDLKDCALRTASHGSVTHTAADCGELLTMV